MVESGEELHLALVAESLVAERDSISIVAINFRDKITQVVRVFVTDLGPTAHQESPENDDSILSAILGFLGLESGHQLVAQARVQLGLVGEEKLLLIFSVVLLEFDIVGLEVFL